MVIHLCYSVLKLKYELNENVNRGQRRQVEQLNFFIFILEQLF